LTFTTRPSDSSWISTVWTCVSEDIATMTAVASETWGLVFWQEEGTPHAAVVGPESRTSVAPVPPEATFVGIQFKVGTSLRLAHTTSLVDGGIALPDVRSRSFWLDGRRWRTPAAVDAELLVDDLARHGVLARDPVVAEVLRGDRSTLSPRTVERRFRVATGLTRGAVAQIERVRDAAGMLAADASVNDVVEKLGYYDQPHLARMLRRYVGRTASQLRTGAGGAIALDPTQYTTS
jgi:AraC-like DNA-binding protein